MKIRSLQPLVDKVVRLAEQRFVARVGDTVHANKAWLGNNVQVARYIFLSEIISKQIERVLNNARTNRMHHADDDCEARRTSSRPILPPVTGDPFTDLSRTQSDLIVGHLWTRNREHQRRSIPEVFDELYWSSAFGQISNGLEIERNVIKLFANLRAGKVFIQIDVNC